MKFESALLCLQVPILRQMNPLNTHYDLKIHPQTCIRFSNKISVSISHFWAYYNFGY